MRKRLEIEFFRVQIEFGGQRELKESSKRVKRELKESLGVEREFKESSKRVKREFGVSREFSRECERELKERILYAP